MFGLYAGIDIPGEVSDYIVEDSFVLPVDVEAFSASAHAHYLGKELLRHDGLLGFQNDVAIHLAVDSRNQLHQRFRESLAPFQSEECSSPRSS